MHRPGVTQNWCQWCGTACLTWNLDTLVHKGVPLFVLHGGIQRPPKLYLEFYPLERPPTHNEGHGRERPWRHCLEDVRSECYTM